MLLNRQILASTFVLALLPASAICGASDSVEYLSGTVKSIPSNTVGTLSLGDSNELRFTYGRTVYKLSYDRITGTQVTQAEPHRLLGKLKVPTMGHKKAILAVSFRENDEKGTLTFELPSSQAYDLRQTIAERTTNRPGAPAQVATTETNQQPSTTPAREWWGDNYWKTLRNKPQWDSKNPQVATVPTAVGTK